MPIFHPSLPRLLLLLRLWEHHAFKPPSLRLYSAPPTPSPSDLSLLQLPSCASCCFFFHHHSQPYISHNAHKTISPSPDPFIFAALHHNHVSTAPVSLPHHSGSAFTFSLTFIHLSLPYKAFWVLWECALLFLRSPCSCPTRFGGFLFFFKFFYCRSRSWRCSVL